MRTFGHVKVSISPEALGCAMKTDLSGNVFECEKGTSLRS